ncbi:MAG: hybrid sensor histidine kinase/response regulator [Gemmatimonadaceae bacterium]
MTPVLWAALGVALGAAVTFIWSRRRVHRAGREFAAERDHAVRSLDGLRGILQEYIEQREDVEETLRASEERLRRSEERLRTLVDHAAYGIYRWDLESRFVDANPAMVVMLGYERLEELQKLDVLETVFVEPAERARWSEDLALGKLRDWYDFMWRRQDASTVRVRVSPRLVRNDQGRILYCDAIAENVTERLHGEEMVRRGERMAALGRTLAGVAHEINNPLAAIAGFAQLLLKGPLAGEEQHALNTMLHEALRAARIVKDLLAVARRQEAHEPQTVDVNTIVSYIVDTQRYALDTHGIRFIAEFADEPAVVRGDAAQLEQVVLNLVVNARQALEKLIDQRDASREPRTSPTIRVRTAVQEDVVTIDVIDNGPGIATADLARIFDPFFTTKDEGEGSGLGLAVVHGIVTQHGGAIDVVSTLGSGSHFRVSLPRDSSVQQPSETAAATPVAEDETNPLDILVIDDESAIRALLERAFTSRGHAVMQAADGTQALKVASQMPFDVVICDLRMPGLSGREVVRRMRELPTCRQARFILSTGDSTTTEDLQADQELAVAAVVSKPYDLDSLRRLVEQQ